MDNQAMSDKNRLAAIQETKEKLISRLIIDFLLQ